MKTNEMYSLKNNGIITQYVYCWLLGDFSFLLRIQQHSFVEIDHKIFSMVILTLLLI